MNYCTLECILMNGNFNYNDMCNYIQSNCIQDTIQFVQTYYCIFKNSFLVLIVIGSILFTMLFTALSYLNQNYLCNIVPKIVVKLKFSQTLAGVTLLAFANGANDIMTAIIAGNSKSESTALLPIGSIFGAFLFSSTIILSRVINLSPPVNGEIGIQVMKKETLKPILFYLISLIYIILISLIVKQMRWYFALVLILMYIMYCSFVIYYQKKNNNNKYVHDQQTNLEKEKSEQVIQKNDYLKTISDKWKQTLGFVFDSTIPNLEANNFQLLIQMILSTVLIFLSQSILTKTNKQGTPYILITFGFVFAIWILVAFFKHIKKIDPKKMETNYCLFDIYSFLIMIVWINFLCSILINLIQLFTVVTGINSVYIGMTVFAFGNCIGDFLTISTFAQKGKGMVSIMGIYSGQLFDFLLGLGLSMLMRCLYQGSYHFDLFPKSSNLNQLFSNAIIWCVILAALINLLVTILYLIKYDCFLGQKFGKYLLFYYAGFCIITSIIAVLSDAFNQISCGYKA